MGIFTGIAGLGLGHTCGLLWEQLHRHRRRARLKRPDLTPSASDALSAEVDGSSAVPEMQRGLAPHGDPPRLQLVSPVTAPVPNLVRRRLASVRFLSRTIELDFEDVRVAIAGNLSIRCGGNLFRYPDAGSRDALCGLIGARVDRMRSAAGERVELSLDNGCELTIPRAGVAVA